MTNAERIGANRSEEPRREILGNGVEIRFADIEKHAGVVANLFAQPSAIEHLSGIAPIDTPPDINVRRYGARHPEYGILIASEEDIKEYYERNSSSVLLVAVVGETVVGTITVDKPSAPGITYAGVSRLVVDAESRHKGVGRSLLKAANAYVFSTIESGGLECNGAQAGVILGVEGYDLARGLFESEGYIIRHTAPNNCVSWSKNRNRFELRSTSNMGRVPPTRRSDFDRYLPKAA